MILYCYLYNLTQNGIAISTSNQSHMRSNKRNNNFEVVIPLTTSGYSEDELTSIHIAFKLIMKNLYLQSKLKDNSIAQLLPVSEHK